MAHQKEELNFMFVTKGHTFSCLNWSVIGNNYMQFLCLFVEIDDLDKLALYLKK